MAERKGATGPGALQGVPLLMRAPAWVSQKGMQYNKRCAMVSEV